MGSMAMDSAGNIALGFSVSGYDLYPSIHYTGRMKHDPPGQMTIAERSIIEGNGAQTHSSGFYGRWGDYSSMAVDPSDPLLFWYTQQYYPETSDLDWHTRVASFSFADILDINATASSSNICQGQSVALDVEVTGGTGTYDYSWNSIPEGFQSWIKDPVASPDIATRYTVTVSSGGQVKTDTISIDITPRPMVFAGNDTILCRHVAEIQLSGSAENYIAIKWMTSGDGIFTDPYILNPRYIPGINDRNDSIIDLELILFPQSPCPVISDHRIIRMDTCSAIEENQPAGNYFNIYPNPGCGVFKLYLPIDVVMVQISDIAGKLIFRKDLLSENAGELMIDLSDKPAGIYLVRFILGNRIIMRKLVVK
jgi:hypothetical protein